MAIPEFVVVPREVRDKIVAIRGNNTTNPLVEALQKGETIFIATESRNLVGAESRGSKLMSNIDVVGTSTQRDYNRQLERIYLGKLFELVSPNKEFPSSYKMMAELTGVPANIVSNVMKMLDKNGTLKRRFEYNGPLPGQRAGGGRKAYWTITTTKEHAEYLLDKYQATIKRPGFQPKNNGHDTNIAPEIAKAWVDKSEAKSQAKAWVDKCRVYMKAADLINQNLAALKAAGVDVDEEAYLKAINVKHDERLSAIALVMPYIESLEKRRS
jgi:DNA-binding Lrp family transcriptional regulator